MYATNAKNMNIPNFSRLLLGLGDGFVLPQWGQALISYATVPPHAGQLVTLPLTVGTGAVTWAGDVGAFRAASLARNAASRPAAMASYFA